MPKGSVAVDARVFRRRPDADVVPAGVVDATPRRMLAVSGITVYVARVVVKSVVPGGHRRNASMNMRSIRRSNPAFLNTVSPGSRPAPARFSHRGTRGLGADVAQDAAGARSGRGRRLEDARRRAAPPAARTRPGRSGCRSRRERRMPSACSLVDHGVQQRRVVATDGCRIAPKRRGSQGTDPSASRPIPAWPGRASWTGPRTARSWPRIMVVALAVDAHGLLRVPPLRLERRLDRGSGR